MKILVNNSGEDGSNTVGGATSKLLMPPVPVVQQVVDTPTGIGEPVEVEPPLMPSEASGGGVGLSPSPPINPVWASPAPTNGGVAHATQNVGSVYNSATINDDEFGLLQQNLFNINEAYSNRMVGQLGLRDSLLTSLLTGGHLLIESVPGLAKTTAAQTIALTVNGKFSRIQCTPDLLPTDIVGTEIYNQKTGEFRTQLGPVHANFVLLDEINRASAKTQSAMLEAMQEKQTSIGGVMHKLPSPFVVIATQNPIEQEGTYVLPEAQLDRFMMKEVLGYGSSADELEMLNRFDSGALNLNVNTPVVSLTDVQKMQEVTKKVYVDVSAKTYIVLLVNATRNAVEFIGKDVGDFVEVGASPRASLALLACARAEAVLRGRTYVIPEDIKNVAVRVLRHRIILKFNASLYGVNSETIIHQILGRVPTP